MSIMHLVIKDRLERLIARMIMEGLKAMKRCVLRSKTIWYLIALITTLLHTQPIQCGGQPLRDQITTLLDLELGKKKGSSATRVFSVTLFPETESCTHNATLHVRRLGNGYIGSLHFAINGKDVLMIPTAISASAQEYASRDKIPLFFDDLVEPNIFYIAGDTRQPVTLYHNDTEHKLAMEQECSWQAWNNEQLLDQNSIPLIHISTILSIIPEHAEKDIEIALLDLQGEE